MPPILFVAKLGRRTLGTFSDIGDAVAALIKGRGSRRGEGHVVCRYAEVVP